MDFAFSDEQQAIAEVVRNLLPRLKSGGYLIIGHSETLNGIVDELEAVRPTIYRKP